MTIEGFSGLFAAMFIVAMVPGPAVFTIASASMSGGFGRGVNMTVGLLLADFVFILLVVTGLAYVAEAFATLFNVLKYFCAAYLVWMGISLFRSSSQPGIVEHKTTGPASDILVGFFLTLSNPKAIVFYVALLPAFIDFEALTVIDVLGIMACAVLAFGTVNLGYAWLAARANNLVNTSASSGLFNKVAGSVLALTGVGVAVRA